MARTAEVAQGLIAGSLEKLSASTVNDRRKPLRGRSPIVICNGDKTTFTHAARHAIRFVLGNDVNVMLQETSDVVHEKVPGRWPRNTRRREQGFASIDGVKLRIEGSCEGSWRRDAISRFERTWKRDWKIEIFGDYADPTDPLTKHSIPITGKVAFGLAAVAQGKVSGREQLRAKPVSR